MLLCFQFDIDNSSTKSEFYSCSFHHSRRARPRLSPRWGAPPSTPASRRARGSRCSPSGGRSRRASRTSTTSPSVLRPWPPAVRLSSCRPSCLLGRRRAATTPTPGTCHDDDHHNHHHHITIITGSPQRLSAPRARTSLMRATLDRSVSSSSLSSLLSLSLSSQDTSGSFTSENHKDSDTDPDTEPHYQVSRRE